MNTGNDNAPLDDQINDPGNEDPGSVWPIQQEPNQHPPIDEDEQVHEQDDAE